MCLWASGSELLATTPQGKFSKVLIVLFENESANPALNQPFFGKLAREGAFLDDFHAETHPSQPNYIALISGDQRGCTDNRKMDLDDPQIADLLEKANKTWKVYAEGFPGKCFEGESDGRYVRRHNPFISFRAIQSVPARCARIVNAAEFAKDVEHGSLPDFSFYIPDLNNDGHDTGVKYADDWYARTFGPLLEDSRFRQGMLLVTTFDESSLADPTNHIYTSLYGDSVKPGSLSKDSYDHYSLLKLIEDEFQLGNLGGKDRTANPITGIWK